MRIKSTALKLLLIISVLIPSVSWGAFSVSGVTNPTSISGITTPPSVAGVTAAYTNIFTNDTHCKALWKFDDDALTTDSKGSNTLTNDGVAEELVDYKEGNGCGNWELSETDFQYITDANWVGPWRSDDAVKSGSVCVWTKIESLPAEDVAMVAFGKYTAATNKRSIAMGAWREVTTLHLHAWMILGFNSGTQAERVIHDTDLSIGTWYHFTFSYDNSDKSWAIRIRDANGDVVGTDATGTATLDVDKLFVSDARVDIGAINIGTLLFYDGLKDEMAVFDDIITADESTAISKGLYR